MAERQPPRFYGVRTYQDPYGRFIFRYPTGWHEFQLEGREGVMYSPLATNPQTWFSVWVDELEQEAVAEDIDDLREAVDEGLRELEDVKVESGSEEALGNLLKFERIFTFAENGVTRKRKFWILYVAKWLIVATWQGETEEEYEYWLPMGNYAFNTFTLPPTMWFMTDRDLSGLDKPFLSGMMKGGGTS